MKIYKVNIATRIFATFFCLLIFSLEINIIFDEKVNLLLKTVAILGIVIFVSIIYLIHGNKIVINDEGIEEFFIPITFLFGKKEFYRKQSFSWNEIEEMRATYVLYPESPIINLIPRKDANRKPFSCLVGGMGMDIDLLIDILAHLPSGVKIDLYL